MKLKCGIDKKLEEEADQILRDERAMRRVEDGTYKYSDLNDYLNEHQLRTRVAKEVYTVQPIERELFEGCYHRAYNPSLRTRLKNLARKENPLKRDERI